MKINNKLSFVLSLVSVLALTSCGPTTSPSIEEPTTSPDVSTPTNPTSRDDIVYPEGVIMDSYPSKALKVGDQMYDFTFSDVNNMERYLSTEVSSNHLVVLNFFASWCTPCQQEFPAMEETYRKYSDEITFIALTVEEKDTSAKLKKSFIDKYDITFTVGFDNCGEFFGEHFLWFDGNPEGYIPFTIMIDRYGTIVFKEYNSIPTLAGWEKHITKFIGDDYLPYGY